MKYYPHVINILDAAVFFLKKILYFALDGDIVQNEFYWAHLVRGFVENVLHRYTVYVTYITYAHDVQC